MVYCVIKLLKQVDFKLYDILKWLETFHESSKYRNQATDSPISNGKPRFQGINRSQKSNLYCIRDITPKRVTSGGVHLRGLAPGQHSCEETSQRWRQLDRPGISTPDLLRR